jgi:hypothetical protein
MHLIIFLISINLVYSLESNIKHNFRPTEQEIKEIHLKYIKFMKHFQKIYENYNGKNRYETKNITECQDPDDEFMMINHLNLINYFKEFIGMINLKEVKNIFQNLIIKGSNEDDSVFSKNQTECPQKLQLGIKPTGLCNSRNTLQLRTNMYPAIRSQVKCICDKCLNLKQDDLQFRCTPVKILMPGLMRDRMCYDGIFDWKPILEWVSIACECTPVEIL